MTATPAATIAGPGSPEDQTPPLVEPTGTWLDEIIPIYVSLAIPGPLRHGYTPLEVDAMEVPLVGALLRVGYRPKTVEDEMAAMLAKRVEADRLGLPDPEW